MTPENTTDETSQTDEQPILDAFKLTKENFPDVKTNLIYFIQVMSHNVYIYLGLVPIPGTEEIIFDLEQAKLSIDLIETMINFGKPQFDDQLKREFEGLLSQMQMNYVTKSKSSKDKNDQTTGNGEKSENDD
ncbi:MAG: DUF1844 domain-containing protein [bacterium]